MSRPVADPPRRGCALALRARGGVLVTGSLYLLADLSRPVARTVAFSVNGSASSRFAAFVVVAYRRARVCRGVFHGEDPVVTASQRRSGACTTSSARLPGPRSSTSALFFAVVFWLAVAFLGLQGRAPPDRGSVARRRGDGARTRAAVRRAVHLHALPAAGVPRGRARARARDQGDGAPPRRRDLHCPVCRAEVDYELPRLSRLHDEAPAGVHRLQGAARGAWQVCPFCETPIESDGTAGAGRPARAPPARQNGPRRPYDLAHTPSAPRIAARAADGRVSRTR